MQGLRRQLAWTVVWQGSGAAATLLAALWIGIQLGPQQQGQFNALKSLVELGAALAMLGMPQALYVYAQTGRIGVAQARALAQRVAIVGVPAGAVLAGVAAGADPPGLGLVIALAAAVAAATLQGQWRTLVLLGPSAAVFNVTTAAPQWGLLGLAACVVLAQGVSATTMAWALAAVWGMGCAVAFRALRPVERPGTPGPASVPMGALARHGAATWLATSMAAAAVVLLQQIAASRGGAVDLGRVSLALMLAQVPLTPLNYALPILLRHRLQRPGPSAGLRVLPWAAAPMFALAGLVFVLGGWRSDLGLGEGYLHLDRLLICFLLAGAAESVLRLVSVEAQAGGRPWRIAVAEAMRLLVLLLGANWGGMLGAADAAEALARWWAAAALAAAVALWFSGRLK